MATSPSEAPVRQADVAAVIAVALHLYWPELTGAPPTASLLSPTEPGAEGSDVWRLGGRTWSRPGRP